MIRVRGRLVGLAIAIVIGLGVAAGAAILYVTVRVTQNLTKPGPKDVLSIYGAIGTALGFPGLVAAVTSTVKWLQRRGTPEEPDAFLRRKVGEDLENRLSFMQLLRLDVALRYGSGERRSLTLDEATAVNEERPRLVFVGDRGAGKSYSALILAASMLRRHSQELPVIVPLSRWDGATSWREWFLDFLELEFRLSRETAAQLVSDGRVLPILDGLDETCQDGQDVTIAADLLRMLLAEMRLGAPVPFVLTCRADIWARLGADLTDHFSMQVLKVRDVSLREARRFMSRAVVGRDDAPEAVAIVNAVSAMAEPLIRNPWRLSMLTAIVARQRPSDDQLRALVSSPQHLVEEFVRSTALQAAGGRLRRLRMSVDLWWLSRYARYLEDNAAPGGRMIAQVALPARDLQLHRLWPVAGTILPRGVDLVVSALLSLPGFVWGVPYLWNRGPIVRVALVLGIALWCALLLRTTTKAWVRPAVLYLEPWTGGRRFLLQTTVAAMLAVVSLLVFPAAVALLVFSSAWLAIGLTVGFGQVLATDAEVRVVGAHGILRKEHQISRFAAWTLLPLLTAGFVDSYGVSVGVPLAALYCLVVGETVASALWRRYLCMIIASFPFLPLTPARFMRRMHRLGFLRTAGLSYQFRQDDVRNHFATRRKGPWALLRS